MAYKLAVVNWLLSLHKAASVAAEEKTLHLLGLPHKVSLQMVGVMAAVAVLQPAFADKVAHQASAQLRSHLTLVLVLNPPPPVQNVLSYRDHHQSYLATPADCLWDFPALPSLFF